jgi:hypothetical protein
MRKTTLAIVTAGLGLAGVTAAQAGVAPYPELLASVCAPPVAPSAAATPASLKGKEAIVGEAERLTLPADTQRLLVERLSSNAFSVDEDQLWAPFESFDVTLQARSEEAGLLKAKLSEKRLREYQADIGRLPAAQQDAIRRAALIILADTGHLPEITLADSRVRFIYREACVVNDAPGLMTTYMQGRLRELDLATGNLGPTFFLKPEKATLSDPAVAFSSDGAAVFQIRSEQIERVFAEPATRQMLEALYDQTLDVLDDPERMKQALGRLVELFQRAYGIDPVKFVFDTSARDSDGSAYYFDNTRSYLFHYDRFLQRLDRFVAAEKLDLARPADRERAREHMFGEIVNNAAHEMAHAGQHQWAELLRRSPGAVPQALRARIADYQKNRDYKNSAWESHALIGAMGSSDYDRYRHQPLEEDAWAVGAYAETRALALVSGTTAPAVQAKAQPVETPALPEPPTAAAPAAGETLPASFSP